jgi:hypothetical protein
MGSRSNGGERVIPPRGVGAASSGSLYQQQQRLQQPAYGESAASLDWTVASSSSTLDSRMDNLKLSTSNAPSNSSLAQSRDRLEGGSGSSPNPVRQRTQYDETRQMASSRDRLAPSNASNSSLSSPGPVAPSSRFLIFLDSYNTQELTFLKQSHYHKSLRRPFLVKT